MAERGHHDTDRSMQQVLFITLILIMFVSLLGTFTIISYVDGQHAINYKAMSPTGYVGITLQQPTAEHIKVGEQIETPQS